MKVKVGIIKMSAEGEQVSVEGDIDTTGQTITGEQLRVEFAPFFDLIDDRLREMNERVIASNHLVKRLPVDAQMAIHQAIDMLYGKAPREEVHQHFEAAKKEAEENQEKAFQFNEEQKKGIKGGKGGKGSGPVGNA